MIVLGPLLCAAGLTMEVAVNYTPGIVFCACCFLISLAITVRS
jgi:hypothetical protein